MAAAAATAAATVVGSLVAKKISAPKVQAVDTKAQEKVLADQKQAIEENKKAQAEAESEKRKILEEEALRQREQRRRARGLLSLIGSGSELGISDEKLS